jgi:hypothetical protein
MARCFHKLPALVGACVFWFITTQMHIYSASLARCRAFSQMLWGFLVRGCFIFDVLGVQWIDLRLWHADQVASGSALGQKCARVMQKGGLLPSSTVLALLRKRIASDGAGSWILLDGFPRCVTLPPLAAKVATLQLIRSLQKLQLKTHPLARKGWNFITWSARC